MNFQYEKKVGTFIQEKFKVRSELCKNDCYLNDLQVKRYGQLQRFPRHHVNHAHGLPARGPFHFAEDGRRDQLHSARVLRVAAQGARVVVKLDRGRHAEKSENECRSEEEDEGG